MMKMALIYIPVSYTHLDQTCGSVLVGNDTTLEIKGEVYGLTKLNVNGSEYMARFVENHCYIQAKASSSGNFTIEGTQYTNCLLYTSYTCVSGADAYGCNCNWNRSGNECASCKMCIRDRKMVSL